MVGDVEFTRPDELSLKTSTWPSPSISIKDVFTTLEPSGNVVPEIVTGVTPDGVKVAAHKPPCPVFNGLNTSGRRSAFVSPAAMVGAFTYALVGRKDLPQSSLRELIDFARKNPGKLSIATSGIGSGQYVMAVLFKRLAEVDILEVAYKGAQPVYTDLLSGRVDLFFDNTTTVRPFAADGRVKPIVTSGAKRDALLPNVPTGREGGLEGLVLDSWIGLFAPAKTPAAAIDTLRAATARALENAEVRKRMEANGWRILSMSPAETGRFVRSEAEKWPKFLQQAGIRAE